MSATQVQFLGGAGTVTGSKLLVSSAGAQTLVDCGLFQGIKELRLRNREPIPVEASRLSAVVLTHAHIDHSGFLPRLVKQGFSGPVYCTPASLELLKILLPDAGHLQEEEARYANKEGFSKHSPALPLYTLQDARDCLRLLKPLDYGTEAALGAGMTAKLQPSGHILGSGSVEMALGGHKLLVSGDLGGYDCAVMRPPAPIPPGMDHIVVECTYGGRVQDPTPIPDQLVRHIRPVLDRKGVVVIPAFAVGRTTVLLYHLRRLEASGRLPEVPVFVDSPMATDAVEIYRRFAHEHNIGADVLEGSIRLRQTRLVRSSEESKGLNRMDGPAIILSASGMATGGRILHHLKNRLPDANNLVLLAGYQAEGTRGRSLQEGAAVVKIHGEEVPVRARVATVNGISAHGDSNELLRWLSTCPRPPKRLFLAHGEASQLKALADKVKRELGWACHIPSHLERIELARS
ncbi:MAG: MBL fold metallo-hydrolase [Elusimicrobiota bacterium]